MTTRSSITPSSAAARWRRTRPRAHKLRTIGSFTIQPKGPFTLASAARFVAGWPLGRVRLTQRGDAVHGTVEADDEPRAIEQAAKLTDVAPKGEPRLERAVQERYGRPLAEVADGWRPFRTWISVLIRSHA